MEFIKYNDSFKKQVYDLYCDFQKEDDFYKQMTEEEFNGHLFKNPYFQPEGTFLAVEDNKLLGIGGALVRSSDDNNPNASGYIPPHLRQRLLPRRT